MKLSRWDVCKDRKIVWWCRTPASSHSWQGVVDDRMNEVAPGRTAVLCCWIDQGLGGSSQHCFPIPSQQAAPTTTRAWCQFFCEVARGIVSDMSNVTPRYLGLAEGQGFVTEGNIPLTLSFLVDVEGCRHHFCSAELYLPGLEVFTYSYHVFALHPFHCLLVSISMDDC